MTRIFIASTPWNPDKKWHGPPCTRVGVAIKINESGGKRTFVAGGTNLKAVPLLILEALKSVKVSETDKTVTIYTSPERKEIVEELSNYVFEETPKYVYFTGKRQKNETAKMYAMAKKAALKSTKKQFLNKDRMPMK